MPHKTKSHPLSQSPLYKLRTRRKLAALLPTSYAALQGLSQTKGRYECWDAEKKNGGTRRIEAPHDNLKIVQKRLADLLQRIETPDFLMAPRKGRSYVDNAAAHVGARAFRLLDIEDFFPSCTDKRVYWFFHTRMQCAPDVAAILTRLVTFSGRLPQGSPCSPILAYFAYEDMWAQIEAVIHAAGCTLSIYADDITISGDQVYERDVWAVKELLFRYGFRYSKSKERSVVAKPADVTGVIVATDTLLLPNRQHHKLAQLKRTLIGTRNKRDREVLERKLRGRVAQAGQVSGYMHSRHVT